MCRTDTTPDPRHDSDSAYGPLAERNALFGFALAAIEWARKPTTATRRRLVVAARNTGPSTGVPEAFTEFADWLERQPILDEGGLR